MRTLIIDDSRTTRTIISRLLKGLGYETSEAGNGIEALSRIEADGPADIAFVDWNMPGMTGIEFVQSVRTRHECDAMRIVMVTSENEIGCVSEALAAGADEYLMKPFSSEALEEKIALLGTR